MKVLLLAVALLTLPMADACSLAVQDAVGDTDPEGLPDHYDLVEVNLTSDATNLTWTWKSPTLVDASSVIFFGSFKVGNSTGPWFHPDCSFETVGTDDATIYCDLTSIGGNTTAGFGVDATYLQPLNYSLGSDWISVDVPLEAVGLSPGMAMTNIFSITQLIVSTGIPGHEGSVHPRVTDRMGPWEWTTCAVDAAASSDETATTPEKDEGAPSPALWVLLLSLLIAAAAKRRTA